MSDGDAFTFIRFGREAPARYGLSSSAANVIKSLAMHANPDTGECWPNIKTLMSQCSLGRSAINSAIWELKQVGVLTSTPTGRSALWTLHDVEPGPVAGRDIVKSREAGKPSKSGTPHRSGVPHTVKSGVPHTVKSGTPHTEEPPLKSQGEEPSPAATERAAIRAEDNGKLHSLDAASTEPSRTSGRAREAASEIDIRRLRHDGTIGDDPDPDLWTIADGGLRIRDRAKMRTAIARWARREMGATHREQVASAVIGRLADGRQVEAGLAFTGDRNGVVAVEEIKRALYERGVWPP